jgi:Abnormal spindle-like microcephaly-assoc'd, ASPM-SPD-2-Hydin
MNYGLTNTLFQAASRALAGNGRGLFRTCAPVLFVIGIFLTNGAPKANAQLMITPSAAHFGNVPVGTTNTQTFQLTNVGRATATVFSLGLFGTGFSTPGTRGSFVLAPGASATFSLAFSPTTAQSYSGSLGVVSNAPGRLGTVLLSGSGESRVVSLSASPANLSFGNVNVGASANADVTVQNTGNSSVTIKSVTPSGAGLSVAGLNAGTTIAPGQSAQIVAEFSARTGGVTNGSITITSNASTITIPVTADAVSTAAHSVGLSWGASSSTGVSAYNVYRSTTTSAGFSKLTSVASTSYSDHSVQSGATYYYVVTSVSSGGESGFSNQTKAIIP